MCVSLQDYGINVEKSAIVTEIDSSLAFGSWAAGFVPCITASRGRARGFHINLYNRRLTLDELMRCQGMSPRMLEGWNGFMNAASMGHAVGNAMSVTVLERLIPRVLFSASLLSEKMTDMHEDSSWLPPFAK